MGDFIIYILFPFFSSRGQTPHSPPGPSGECSLGSPESAQCSSDHWVIQQTLYLVLRVLTRDPHGISDIRGLRAQKYSRSTRNPPASPGGRASRRNWYTPCFQYDVFLVLPAPADRSGYPFRSRSLPCWSLRRRSRADRAGKQMMRLCCREENKAVCRICKIYLDSHFAWQCDLSQDDLCSRTKMLEYCREKLNSGQMATLQFNIDQELERVRKMTAWRIEGTLRNSRSLIP